MGAFNAYNESGSHPLAGRPGGQEQRSTRSGLRKVNVRVNANSRPRMTYSSFTLDLRLINATKSPMFLSSPIAEAENFILKAFDTPSIKRI